ncbi:uncharacterized protein LOC127737147 [Mytilus californianus]|uniref:uncharacterized protein LOC127737147 n=1 Tax=Mytilus californianus TaxID=6549 RepID=UPI002246CCA1|nr:uncharacterized protein LOC127737147 [Mytilus californianus]
MNENRNGILIVQTGGTIDKRYPRTHLGYAFEIEDPAAQRIISRAKVPYTVQFVTACRKDSQDINQQERQKILDACKQSIHKKILITHGTDTMIETGAFLAEHHLDKTVVLTGAFLPEAFKDSDADFNVGFAIGALQVLDKHGVFIVMNGKINEWNKITRNEETFVFTNKQ